MTIFFWVADLMIPFIIILFGLICKFAPPKKINSFYGYRTSRSMKSQKTWDYAHKRIGAIWPKIGSILLILIIFSKLFSPIDKQWLSLIHSGLGIIALLVGIPIIEKELGKYFDKDGIPRF